MGGAEPGGSGYLPSGCRCELKAPQHHTQQRQELFVLVVKAVPEDNRTDDVGDSSAQEEGGIDEGAWGGRAAEGQRSVSQSVISPKCSPRAQSWEPDPQPQTRPFRGQKAGPPLLFPSWCRTVRGPRLTARAPEGFDEEARLLLDALLDAALAHAEVAQRGDGEAPELFSALPVAEHHACGGE